MHHLGDQNACCNIHDEGKQSNAHNSKVWSWKKDSALIELPMSMPTKIVATGARISSAASFSEGFFILL